MCDHSLSTRCWSKDSHQFMEIRTISFPHFLSVSQSCGNMECAQWISYHLLQYTRDLREIICSEGMMQDSKSLLRQSLSDIPCSPVFNFWNASCHAHLKGAPSLAHLHVQDASRLSSISCHYKMGKPTCITRFENHILEFSGRYILKDRHVPF